jgi:hypothetical protein
LLFHCKSQMYWAGMYAGSPRWQAGDWPSEPWYDLVETVELSLRISSHENTTEIEDIAPYTSTFLTNGTPYPK